MVFLKKAGSLCASHTHKDLGILGSMRGPRESRADRDERRMYVQTVSLMVFFYAHTHCQEVQEVEPCYSSDLSGSKSELVQLMFDFPKVVLHT